MDHFCYTNFWIPDHPPPPPPCSSTSLGGCALSLCNGMPGCVWSQGVTVADACVPALRRYAHCSPTGTVVLYEVRLPEGQSAGQALRVEYGGGAPCTVPAPCEKQATWGPFPKVQGGGGMEKNARIFFSYPPPLLQGFPPRKKN